MAENTNDGRRLLFVATSARDGAGWTGPYEVYVRPGVTPENPVDILIVAAGGRAKGRTVATLSPIVPQIGILQEALIDALASVCRACRSARVVGIDPKYVTQGHSCGRENAP